MINEKKVKRFCKEYTKIENYEEAVKDITQTWHCHHILGEILTKQQLQDHDFYYDVPPCMLKFVTGVEHRKLHHKGKQYSEVTRRKMSESLKGHTVSEETRCKMSEARKGKPSPRKGVTLSEETRRKMSEAHKGYTVTDDTRRKISEAKKGHTVTDDTRRKISEAKKGHTVTEESRRKMSEAHQNISKEHRKKLSEAHKGKTWKVIDGKRVWLTKEVFHG